MVLPSGRPLDETCVTLLNATMHVLKDVTPYLTPRPESFPDDVDADLLSLSTPDLHLCIPLPPWSTAEDLDQTSGLIDIGDHDDIHVNWNEDWRIDGVTKFQITPRSQPLEERGKRYAVFCEHEPQRWLRAGKSIARSERIRRITGVQMLHDPYGHPRTAVLAFCEIRVSKFYISLSHEEWFDAFDPDDEGQWPLDRSQMDARMDRVARLWAALRTE